MRVNERKKVGKFETQSKKKSKIAKAKYKVKQKRRKKKKIESRAGFLILFLMGGARPFKIMRLHNGIREMLDRSWVIETWYATAAVTFVLEN